MERGLDELSEREKSEIQQSLNLSGGEFAALMIGALLTLAVFLGPPTLATDMRHAVRATVSVLSGAVIDLGDRLEARAAERKSGPAKP